MEATSLLSKMLLILEAEVCPIALEIEQSTSFRWAMIPRQGWWKQYHRGQLLHSILTSLLHKRHGAVQFQPLHQSLSHWKFSVLCIASYFSMLCIAFVFSYCEGFTAFHTTSQARPTVLVMLRPTMSIRVRDKQTGNSNNWKTLGYFLVFSKQCKSLAHNRSQIIIFSFYWFLVINGKWNILWISSGVFSTVPSA